MAKGFLTTLDNAFDESALVDIIPFGKNSPPVRKRQKAGSTPTAKRTPSKRKSFLDALDHAMGSGTSSKNTPSRQSTSAKGKRKSFLSTLEKTFDDPALDELIPIQNRSISSKKKDARKPQSRLSTSLDSKLLTDVRKYADKKDMRIKEVIEDALKEYLNKRK